MDRGDVGGALATLGAVLAIPAKATVSSRLGESTFDQPSTGQNLKANMVWRLSDDAKCVANPVDQAALVVDAISPQLLQTGSARDRPGAGRRKNVNERGSQSWRPWQLRCVKD
jgi:hypothetical protein